MGINKMHQHFPFQGPPKCNEIGIFGLEIYHLATLTGTSRLYFESERRHRCTGHQRNEKTGLIQRRHCRQDSGGEQFKKVTHRDFSTASHVF
jgi:hypothetical protein